MSQDGVAMVTLRTGEELPEATVATHRVLLDQLYRSQPMAFMELVLACRDENHTLFGNTGATLQSFGLIVGLDASKRPTIHDDIRRVVLAASEGESATVHPVSPYPPLSNP